jgi:hypothetical protein
MAGAYGGLFDTNYYSATTSFTVTRTLPLGSYLIFSLSTNNSVAPTTISDSASGSWTQIGTLGGPPFMQSWFRYTKGTGASFTITVNFPSSTNVIYLATYYTGINGANITGATGMYSPSVLSSITSPTAANDGDLIFAVGSTIGPPFLTGAGSGFTLNYNSNIANYQIAHESRVTQVSENITAQFAATTIGGNALYTYVLANTPATRFTGWGIPLK